MVQEAHDVIVARGFTEAQAADFAQLDEQLAQERVWYANAPRFAIDADILAAHESGQLVELSNSTDLQRIGRFEGTSQEQFMPFLTPNAANVASLFAVRWREHLTNVMKLDMPEARLAVTSMVRSQAYQQHLVDSGKLASPDSTHCTGNAFDIDGAGYYKIVDGKVIACGHPARKEQREVIRGSLEAQFGPSESPAYEDAYDIRILSAAHHVAQSMAREGIINLVEEFTGTPNACLHIAAAPQQTS